VKDMRFKFTYPCCCPVRALDTACFGSAGRPLFENPTFGLLTGKRELATPTHFHIHTCA